MMEQEEQLLIGELARRAGVTPRTIRYYTSEGLLPPPVTRGKYAHYSDEHLRRLRLIARLKEEYLPLSAIRGRLATMGAAEAARLLGESPDERSGYSPHRLSGGGAPSPAVPGAGGKLAERPGSYGLSAGQVEGQAPGAPQLSAAGLSDPFRLTPGQLPLGRVEFFPAAPEGEEPAAQERPQGPAGREEIWRHYAVAPGVELRVREPLSPRRRRQIEALLAAIRDKLLSEED
jgi:DNA-binding transcriptional MerR regulator